MVKVTGIHTRWYAHTQMGACETDEVWINFIGWIHIYILILMLYCRFSSCYWGRVEYIGFPCVISYNRMGIYTITRETLYTVVFQSQRASVWIPSTTSCLCSLLLNLPQPQMGQVHNKGKGDVYPRGYFFGLSIFYVFTLNRISFCPVTTTELLT